MNNRVAIGFGMLVGLLLVLGGCQRTHSVRGKVIAGNLSFVAVVDQGDERLKAVGIPGAEVAGRADVGNVGGFLFAQTKSDEKGNFTLKFKEQNLFLKPVEFSASKDGYRLARGSINIPPEERWVLIIMPPAGPSPAGTR